MSGVFIKSLQDKCNTCCRVLMVVIIVIVNNNRTGNANETELTAELDVFSPKGFKVKIPHEEDVEFIAFNLNINRGIERKTLGEISDLLHLDLEKAFWVTKVHDVHLQIGDRLQYWLFVKRNNVGCVYTNIIIIQEITPGTLDETETANNPQPSSQTDRNETTTIDSSSCNAQSQDKQVCEGTLVDLTRNLIDLQNELSSARQDVATLRQIVEKDSEASVVLKLDGRLPAGEEPLATAQKIIREILGLPITVQRAYRSTDNSVTFEVNSLTEKLSIAREAETKLRNSGIFITV